jgi:hypothetical protein
MIEASNIMTARNRLTHGVIVASGLDARCAEESLKAGDK